MTRPIRYLPSHDVIAMRYACMMVCGHCSHCCCRACFSRKLCSCGVGSVIMEVYDGVRNLWFSVISKPYRLRSLVFRVCMNACVHVADNPIGLFLLRFRCSMNITRTVNIYPTCGDMWKSFRFIISWWQCPDCGAENDTLLHNGIAAVIDAFMAAVGYYSKPPNHVVSATACFHCKIHMNNHRFSCHRTVA